VQRLNLSLPDSKRSDSAECVSVVLPTHEPNTEYLYQSIQSVADQTYENVELVIVDSTGLDQLRRLAEDHRWILHRYQEPSGLPAAWNAGVEATNGQYISFLSDDDFYTEEKIARQVEALEEGYDIVYSDEYIIDENGSLSYLSALSIKNFDHHYIDYFQEGQGVPHLTLMGRTTCFRTESYDERLEVREDPHLWVRLFKRYDVTKINEALAYKRRRRDSSTGDPEQLYENELLEIDLLCEEFPELEQHRETREQMAKYRYGKHLFRLGRTNESRTIFIELLKEGMTDHRVMGLFLATFLPVNSERTFQWVEKAAKFRAR